jgi:hypothetical protein
VRSAGRLRRARADPDTIAEQYWKYHDARDSAEHVYGNAIPFPEPDHRERP